MRACVFCVCVCVHQFRGSVSLCILLQRVLLMTNGCYGSSNVTECASVLNGVFSNGLQGAVQYFSGLLREAMVVRTQTNITVCAPLCA